MNMDTPVKTEQQTQFGKETRTWEDRQKANPNANSSTKQNETTPRNPSHTPPPSQTTHLHPKYRIRNLPNPFPRILPLRLPPIRILVKLLIRLLPRNPLQPFCKFFTVPFLLINLSARLDKPFLVFVGIGRPHSDPFLALLIFQTANGVSVHAETLLEGAVADEEFAQLVAAALAEAVGVVGGWGVGDAHGGAGVGEA
jgi:hypothetical protein